MVKDDMEIGDKYMENNKHDQWQKMNKSLKHNEEWGKSHE